MQVSTGERGGPLIALIEDRGGRVKKKKMEKYDGDETNTKAHFAVNITFPFVHDIDDKLSIHSLPTLLPSPPVSHKQQIKRSIEDRDASRQSPYKDKKR